MRFFKDVQNVPIENVHEILLQTKYNLEVIKNSHSGNERKELLLLLKCISLLLKNPNLTFNFKASSWLLLADIYSTLSVLPPTGQHSVIAVEQAIKCVDKVNDVVKSLPSGERLDSELIKQYNTFNVADPSAALDLIQKNLIPTIKNQNVRRELFKPLGP